MISASHADLGTCYICHKTIDAANATTHLKKCSQAASDEEDTQVFLLRIATENQFWLYMRANSDTTLQSLYMFLRNNWYECCGHLSEFFVAEQSCSEADMQKTLQQMLGAGKTFHYEHNSGVPTRVSGEVLEVTAGKIDQDMQLILRKNILEDRCESCEKIQ